MYASIPVLCRVVLSLVTVADERQKGRLCFFCLHNLIVQVRIPTVSAEHRHYQLPHNVSFCDSMLLRASNIWVQFVRAITTWARWIRCLLQAQSADHGHAVQCFGCDTRKYTVLLTYHSWFEFVTDMLLTCYGHVTNTLLTCYMRKSQAANAHDFVSFRMVCL